MIVTYRDSDLTKDHPLTGVLADLRRSEGVERIRLSGLGPDEVAELVAAAAGHELDADGLALAGGLATETGGNPFFVGEILRNLIESGAITFDETARRWSVDQVAMSSLPESVREVVEHRIDRLGEHGREALTIAAVIGRSFDVELLAQLVEMSEARLLDQLEAAVQASLLRESTEVVGRFDFEHALINHTLYQGLGGTRRARLHHRVAEAIEQLYGTDSDEHLGELALHWRLATVSVDRPRAAGYSLRAGRRALDSLAPSEAAKLFGDALDMLGSAASAARCEALIGLGEAQRQTGVPAYRETLLEAAGIASELAGRRPRRPCGAGEQSRLREPHSVRSTRSGSRRSSGRSSSTTRRSRPATRGCCRCWPRSWRSNRTAPGAVRWATRRSRSPARRPIRGRSRRRSKAPATPPGRRTRSPRGPSRFAS